MKGDLFACLKHRLIKLEQIGKDGEKMLKKISFEWMKESLKTFFCSDLEAIFSPKL